MEKDCLQNPNPITETILIEPIDKDSFRDIFNDFNLIGSPNGTWAVKS